MPLVNWCLVGTVFLTCLFVLPYASLDVTETLSSRKYAAFAAYQRRVSRFVPMPPCTEADAFLPSLSLGDRLLVGWFIVGIAITYLIDIEQVTVEQPDLYGTPGYTPRWPPEPFVRAIHWWGATADNLVLARPPWYKAAILLEVFVQAPFYAVALFAFARQRDWIRVPAIMYSVVLLTILPMVLTEQYLGPHRTEKPLLVTAVYSPYVIMPIVVLARVLPSPTVFPKRTPSATPTPAAYEHKANGRSAASGHNGHEKPRAGRSPVRRAPKQD